MGVNLRICCMMAIWGASNDASSVNQLPLSIFFLLNVFSKPSIIGLFSKYKSLACPYKFTPPLYKLEAALLALSYNEGGGFAIFKASSYHGGVASLKGSLSRL